VWVPRILFALPLTLAPHSVDGQTVSADLDADGDVDLSDFGLLQACLTGPMEQIQDPACVVADLDGDTDADTADLQLLASCLSGASVSAISACPDPVMVVSPNQGLVSAGPAGGPFTPSSIAYTLCHEGQTPLDWRASWGPLWLEVIPVEGTLADGATQTAWVALNAEAETLPAQSEPYRASLQFINRTNGAGTHTFPISLRVVTAIDAGLYSSASWQNIAIAPKNGVFVMEFDVVPGAVGLEGLLTLSEGAVSSSADAVIAVRFNPAGTIEALNDDTYAADEVVPYAVGMPYHVRIIADVPRLVYSTYVTPPETDEIELAKEFAFSSAAGVPAVLDHLGIISSVGYFHLFNLQPDTSGPLTVSAGREQTITVGQSATLPGSAQGGTGLFTYAWSPAENISDPAAARPTVWPAESTEYTLTVTDSDDTTISDSTVVNVTSPIARWNVVPYQRIEPGAPLACGVMAFHIDGIEKVTFHVTGQGYTGPAEIEVTDATYNPRTGCYEYWIYLDAGAFTSDGPITVDATAVGLDGSVRHKDSLRDSGWGLNSLPLVVNATGSLPQPQAWVDPIFGNDATGQVDVESQPFLTIGKAMGAIRQWMLANGYGDKADGGIVRLKSGYHRMDDGGVISVPTYDEWLTITTAEGGSRTDTVIYDRASMTRTERLKVKGVSLHCSQARWPIIPDLGPDSILWVDDCELRGVGRLFVQSHPIGYGHPVWYTDSYISECDFATPNADLARGLTIENIGHDAFQLCPMVINCTVDNVDPSGLDWHADAWQWYGGGPFNAIIYNYRATGLHYQSLFIRAQGVNDIPPNPGFHDVALINCYFELADPIYSGGGGGSIRCSGDHLLMWHCTFQGSTDYEHLLGLFDDSFSDGQPDPIVISHFSSKGNYFDRVWYTTTGGGVDFTQWDQNHYAHTEPGDWGVAKLYTVTPGTNYTAGTGFLDAFGVPLPDSPLLGRISPLLIPVDAQNVLRDNPADVGAYENVTAGP